MCVLSIRRSPHAAVALTALLPLLTLAQPSQKPDAATAAWWAQTTALANDSMEGRDTGAEAYERAAKYVAAQFSTAGLKPAGELLDGKATFFQSVPMHQVSLDVAHSSIEIVPSDAKEKPVALQLLQEITVAPRDEMPKGLIAPMVFVGDGMIANGGDVRGKVAVFFNYIPSSVEGKARDTFAARRAQALVKTGAAAIISIDNPNAIEPFHWPAAYARTVTLKQAPVAAGTVTALQPGGPPSLRISAESAPALFASSGHTFASVLALSNRGDSMPAFPLQASLRLHLVIASKDISSPNILGLLPGSDPKLAPEYVALSAHLDGYGFGTPVHGDNLYNGALDDAAYVATLIELAKDLRRKAPARSLLFCIFTGEEKGLLGSAWFTAHPTVPPANIVADLNLDQLRPIFPLKALTMEGLSDSTLGDTVRSVAAPFQIEIRPDFEPERNLFRRADNYNFFRIGVPIASFIFGYDKGSPEEAVYRDWYARRYHKPQDDISTPIDWDAAAKFNRFYTALAISIASAPGRPHWLSSSAYSQHQSSAP